MRKLFPGSYAPSKEDFAKMWAEGLFVFDTNMLLNFHRYSAETRQEFLGIVSAPDVSPRIWIPYQVALEYHRHLDDVRHEQVAACQRINQIIKEWGQSLRAGDHKKRAEKLLKVAAHLVAEAEEQYRHPNQQSLIEQIATLFEGKVGPEWDAEQLKKAYKEGEERYAKKIPPGFKDAKKDQGDAQFGDLVVWFQIIEEAEKRKKPVILVTDDVKDDWWLRPGGKTVGPLPALTNEIHRKAGVPFYMYSGDRFLEQARTALKRRVREETVAEVKQVREERRDRQQLLLDHYLDPREREMMARRELDLRDAERFSLRELTQREMARRELDLRDAERFSLREFAQREMARRELDLRESEEITASRVKAGRLEVARLQQMLDKSDDESEQRRIAGMLMEQRGKLEELGLFHAALRANIQALQDPKAGS